MTVTLRFQLLGQHRIFSNQEEIFFSFAKVNALLFYLAINGSVNRELAASLLWGDKPTQTAKKNLRNTIYQANKVLGVDIIICPSRNTLQFNPDIAIESDVHDFLEAPTSHLDYYQGDFLQGFYLKNCEEFELWISKLRLQYEQLYLEASYLKIEKGLSLDANKETERHLKKLIERDEFEEKNYQLLMRLYQQDNRPSKVIETYYQLANLLDKELGIAPSPQSLQIYQEVLAKDRNDRKIKHFLRSSDHFLGRIKEIQQLEACFADCLNYRETQTILLIGDTGIGKRTLARQVLANQTNTFQMVTTECFRDEAHLPLFAWKTIVKRLEDLVIQYRLFSSDTWENALAHYFPTTNHLVVKKEVLSSKERTIKLITFLSELLQELSDITPLIFLIEDIHWMDDDSLVVLQHLLQQLTHHPITFILTKHLGTPFALENCLNALITHGKLKTLHLNPFDFDESKAFVQAQLGNRSLRQKELEDLYHASQGIPFFLDEYTQLLLHHEKFLPLTPAIKAKLGVKFAHLDSLEQEVLDYLACCPTPVPLNTLAQIMSISLEKVILTVDHLCQSYILEESSHRDDVLIAFRQHIVKLYCYDRLSISKRRLQHGQIAKRLEEVQAILPPQATLLEDIAYHYTKSHQELKALEFHLNYLEATLQLQHELFPIYSKYHALKEVTSPDKVPLIEQQFATIRKSVGHLEDRYQNNSDFQQLLIRFSYLEGRYHIRTGHYQEGIKHIQKVIVLASDLNQTSFLLDGYRQLIHYCIQVENKTEMKYYIDLSLEAAISANHFEAIAISLRLKGLYHLIVGDLDEAKQLLQQSIDFFSISPTLEKQYAIQIAAALDYLAEITQVKEDFSSAIAYQKKAIALTNQIAAELPASVFCIGLGISYYDMADFTQAEHILTAAKEGLMKHLLPWKETQLEIYLALTKWQQGDLQAIITILKDKEQLISKYENPRDKGLVYYLMAVVKHRLQEEKASSKEDNKRRLEALLVHPFESYCEVALNHLNPYRDHHLYQELEHLRQEYTKSPHPQ